MTPEDALLSIAEIAIGLAGFSGLVAAFGQRPGHAWKGEERTRIVFLIMLSFGIIVTAILPFALSGVSESPKLIWGVPMVAFSTLTLTLLINWFVLAYRNGYKLQFRFISIPIMLVASVLQIMVWLSGFGLIFPQSPALFVLGLLSILLFSATMFLALLHLSWKGSQERP